MISKVQLIEELNIQAKPKKAIIQEIQNSPLPLVLYGNGDYGTIIFKFLISLNIKVSAICIDRKFILSENKEWNGIPIVATEDISQMFEEFNVVLGLTQYILPEKKMKEIAQCINIYFLDTTLSIDFFNLNFINENLDLFYETYSYMADDNSKSTFVGFINGKLSTRPNVFDLVDPNQYFPEGIIVLSPDEVFVDAGAYIGDTLFEFINHSNGNYNTYYALEPDIDSYTKLCAYIKENNFSDIVTCNKGAWYEKQTLRFSSDIEHMQRSSVSQSGQFTIDVDSIDNILQNKRATFIKMDIEGAELAALEGAKGTIIKYKPKLAICVYHKPEDLITIPQYIKKLCPDYKFYLRQHLPITQELVLYAVI